MHGGDDDGDDDDMSGFFTITIYEDAIYVWIVINTDFCAEVF